MSKLLPLIVFFPMVLAPVSYLVGRSKLLRAYRTNFVVAVTIFEVFLVLAVIMDGAGTFYLPGFCGLGLTLRSGGFHDLMAMLCATGFLSATVLSKEYFAHIKHRNRHYLCWLLTLGATMGVFLSGDLFTTFVFFEVMSMTSYVAVVQTESEQALKAGETYLAVAVIGGMVTLAGLFLLYHQLGTLNFHGMRVAAQAVQDRGPLWMGGLLTLVGFGAKAGVFPLHIWLPTAHPAAPAPASAVLSGVIIKTGIFGILVLSTTIFLHDMAWGLLLAALGGVTMVVGAVLALLSVDLKRTLACSSVSQMGFILIGIAMQCILGEHNALAVQGTILHIVNHSLIKLVLFPAAGIIHLSTHSFDLNKIRGFGRGKPLLMLVMGLPMLSLAGLPMLSGYVSKTLLHESIVEYIHLETALSGTFLALEWLFLFTGGLTLAYMLKLFCCLFVEEGRPWKQGVPYMATASAAVLLVYGALMPMLGASPEGAMIPLAEGAMSFMLGHAPAHPVQWWAWVNLRGALISLGLGVVLYLVVVRRLLMGDRGGERVYLDRLPLGMDLEHRLYRPMVGALARGCILLALLLDRLSSRLIFRTIPGAAAWLSRRVEDGKDRLSRRLTGRGYLPHFDPERPREDRHFARYRDQPAQRGGFFHSFAFGLLLTGLGLALAILFILVRRG